MLDKLLKIYMAVINSFYDLKKGIKKKQNDTDFIPISEVPFEQKGFRQYKKNTFVNKSIKKTDNPVKSLGNYNRMVPLNEVRNYIATDELYTRLNTHRYYDSINLNAFGKNNNIDTEGVTITNNVPIYNNNYNVKISFLTKDNYTNSIKVVGYPTDNCQLSSISAMQNILSCKEKYIGVVFEKIKDNSKPLILIDINIYIEKEIEKIFEPYLEIVTKQHYRSTNNSNMIIYILKWKNNHKLPF